MDYTLRKSKRAKYLRLAVYSDGRVVLTAPMRAAAWVVEQFFRERSAWLRDKLSQLKEAPPRKKLPYQTGDYARFRERALAIAEERASYFNRTYGFAVESIRIRNQKTRWGSCSSRGHISINYRIVHLPRALQDYLIVHELCHLRELNHSRRFWALVERTLPHYRALRRELKGYELTVL